MRWPWASRKRPERLIVSWSSQTLSYVLARPRPAGGFEVLRVGVEPMGDRSMGDYVHHLQGLGLKGWPTRVMLRPAQYQFLQIDAPTVPPEELRAAARYQIREMVQSHIDDITLDVMRVGDGTQKSPGHLFVVAAPNATIREIMQLSDAMRWGVDVIDVQETAQRNLATALTATDATASAQAALVLLPGHQALLTISARDELFYSRRFDVPASLWTTDWSLTDEAISGPAGFTPVAEYVPDYSVGGISYGADYSGAGITALHTSHSDDPQHDDAQRFLIEMQRSVDVWDRAWSSMPLQGLKVFIPTRSAELAQWLGRQLALPVSAISVGALFTGFDAELQAAQAQCLPLLGVLLRSETREL